MLKKFLFVDLDDTLFQSRRKCPDDVPLTPMAYLRDGTAHSYATVAQHSFLNFVQREMTVIPVTARNADAFGRVRWPFGDKAVVNYGGVILGPDGSPDAHWLEHSRSHASKSLVLLEAIRELLAEHAAATGAALRVRIIEDFGVPFYLCAKSEEGDEGDLDKVEPLLRAHCEQAALPLLVHRNGNNLSVLPHWLDKRHAVEHLMTQLRDVHGEIITFGMGDSLSDIGFMSVCDYALVPRASQINRGMGGL